MQPAGGARTLAICLDDFGLHAGVNRAALQLASLGRINAVSCMVAAPQWRTGAPDLADLAAGRIDVGLHLDFTEHTFDAAVRHSLAALIARSEARALDRQRVRAEIVNQLDAFEQAMGRAPDHVDGHQHVHQFPVIRQELVAALLARYPRQRPWLRRTRRPPGLAGFKPWLIEWLGCDALSDLAHAHGFAQNQSLLGVYGFDGNADRYAGLLSQWLGMARQGDLLMCHASGPAAAPDPIAGARANEWQVLAGPAFADLLARENITLAPVGRMLPRA
jgi:chitin disaccharide deacetylase